MEEGAGDQVTPGGCGASIMKRHGIMLVMLAALLLVSGCRRRSSVPQPPVKAITEKDLVGGSGDAAMVFAVMPANRKYELYANMDDLEKKLALEKDPKAILTGLVDKQKKMEDDLKLTADLATLRKDKEKADRRRELEEFGRACAEFVKNNPATSFTENKISAYVRAKNLVCVRKFVDKVDWIIISETTPVRKLMEDKRVIFVSEVDPTMPDQVVAYQKAGPSQGDQWVMLVNGTLVDMKLGQLEMQLAKQALRMLWLNYDGYLKKNPAAEQRDLNKFKDYLKNSAPPHLLQSVETKAILVANPRIPQNPESWIACRNKQNDPPERGYNAVKLSGVLGVIPEETKKAVFE
jgi:hypothetical protein